MVATPRLDLHECHSPLPLHHQVDIAVTSPESALDEPPPLPPEPFFRDALPEDAKRLPGR